METKIINLYSLELTVKYHYEKPSKGDYYTPPTGAYYDIQEVLHNGEDLVELFEGLIKNWEDIIIKELKK